MHNGRHWHIATMRPVAITVPNRVTGDMARLLQIGRS